MTRSPRLASIFGLAFGLALLLTPRAALALVDLALVDIDESAEAAQAEKKYAFCTNPKKPFFERQQNLCQLASEVPQCTGFQAACSDLAKPKDDTSFLKMLGELLGPVAKVLLYLLVLGIIVVVAIPVLRAIARYRRDKKVVAKDDARTRRAELVTTKPLLPEEVADAEDALRRADDHRARGELERALGLYLAASLAALDRRGALRVAHHRTNGEYVRACEEPAARTSLREIVREVDRVEFGGAAPSSDGVVRVAERAKSIVRVVSTMAILLLAAAGCAGDQRGADPAGDELPIEVLRRSGFHVASLGSSLASLPIPDREHDAPVVIVDAERVAIEDETQAHLMRWVEAGGVLVLFGPPVAWPHELGAKQVVPASSRDLTVRTRDPSHGPVNLETVDDDDDDSDSPATPKLPAAGRGGVEPIEIRGAHTTHGDAFEWDRDKAHEGASSSSALIEPETIGFIGGENKTYASIRRVRKGLVLGVANDDLFTNVGVLAHHNAAALVTMIRAAAHHPARHRTPTSRAVAPNAAHPESELRVARAEDGIPPPSSPFAALLAARLGKGVWHALGFAVLLFLAYGIRHARPRSPEPPSRRAFAEHVEATGAFYGRARAHTHALHAYGQYLELRVREMIPRGADPIAFLATRSGEKEERVAELFDRATKAKAGDPPKGDELDVIEELRRLLDRPGA